MSKLKYEAQYQQVQGQSTKLHCEGGREAQGGSGENSGLGGIHRTHFYFLQVSYSMGRLSSCLFQQPHCSSTTSLKQVPRLMTYQSLLFLFLPECSREWKLEAENGTLLMYPCQEKSWACSRGERTLRQPGNRMWSGGLGLSPICSCTNKFSDPAGSASHLWTCGLISRGIQTE